MAETERKKFALITGCTPGGIGHFLALEFAEKGFNVLATVRDPSKYTSPSPRITYLPLELTSDASIRQLRDRVVELTSGKLDILYNNAGINCTVPALDLDMKDVVACFNANVFAVMKMCQTFAPLLIEAKGAIVQTGSLAGVIPYVWGSAYNASKAALHAYSNTLRVELAPLGVRVLTIITGGVKSNIARTHRTLPEGSYYLPLADVYASRLTHSQQVGQDTQKYAKSCVSYVLGGEGLLVKKRWAWEGGKSWLVWFVWNWLPHWTFDWYMAWNFKLARLRGTVGSDRKSK